MKMTNRNRRGIPKGIIWKMGLPTFPMIIFIILKLTHVIDWSWLWVLSTLWISASLGALFFLVIGFILLVAVIGLTNNKSKMIVGIKSWFRKTAQEDNIEE